MSETSLFLGIEGGDGSGKGTQAEILAKQQRALGRRILSVSFPRYGEFSAVLSEKYLRGEYGSANDVHPELASLTYALDRYAASKEIREYLDDGDLVIADRFVASNLAHQGSKIDDENERRAFYERLMNIEFGILGIPKPNKSIVLLVPSSVAQQNVDKKSTRSYTSAKRDVHEADAGHLDKAKRGYEELCKLFPDEFIAIDAVDKDGKMRSPFSVNKEIQKVSGLICPDDITEKIIAEVMATKKF